MNNNLKKEFSKSDVERMRNLVKKDYTASTKLQTGYKKQYVKHKEGDIWEENGRKWTIKNGLKQNITKLDKAKEATKVPLACPKCKKALSYYLSKETYKKNKMCFDCFINYVGELKKNGLYDQFIVAQRKGNTKFFIKVLEEQIKEIQESKPIDFVTEAGDIESWSNNSSSEKLQLTKELQEYVTFLKSKLD